jgi:tetratricopeptide (TPR) repeat protein
MPSRAQDIAVAICLMLASAGVFAQDAESPVADPIELLAAGRYAELDRSLATVQAQYRLGHTTDERLLAAFRPFYYPSFPGVERNLDTWVSEIPESYVARLARGIYYKYRGLHPRVDAAIDYPAQARLLERREAYARAVEDLTASLDLDDKPLMSYHHLMDGKGSLLWYSSNRRLLAKVIAFDPDNLIARRKFLISLAPRWGGSLKAMDDYVEKCREEGLPPRHIEKLEYTVAVERAELSFSRETDYARAARGYSALMALDPLDPRPVELYIAALAKQKKCGELIEVATRLLAVEGRSDDALNNRGFCYAHQGKFADALRDYRAAAALDSNWAQKELARLLWQGRLVEQDRAMALRFLRRAAENGDEEARREFEAKTGEPILRQRPFWNSLLLCALPGFPLAAVGAMTARRRRREKARLPQRLDHAPKKFVVGALALSFFGGLLLASAVFPSSWHPFWPNVILAGFVLASLREALAYLVVRHDVDSGGLQFTRFSGWRGRLAWRDVRRVKYQAFAGYFVIERQSGSNVRISDQLRNLHVFAREVLNRVPSDRMEETAAAIFDGIVRYHGREDWSPADISAQELVPGTRLVMCGATKGNGLALCSTDALPDIASLDAESIEPLQRAHQVIPFAELEDGEYLLHAYVDSAVPEGVEKYSLPLTARSAVLSTKTGGIAFGGLEWMCAGYHDRTDSRSDARIPAGDYDVQAVYMSYPARMTAEAVRRRVGRIATLTMAVLPYTIPAGALAAIAGAAAGSWPLCGLALAAVLAAAVLRYRSAWSRNIESQGREVARNFPHIVANLRPRR